MAKILIVDDEEHIRYLYSEELSEAGYEVITADPEATKSGPGLVRLKVMEAARLTVAPRAIDTTTIAVRNLIWLCWISRWLIITGWIYYRISGTSSTTSPLFSARLMIRLKRI